MTSPEETYNELKNRYTNISGVVEGKMMRALGLKYNNKVFAFFHEEKMGFRLGPNFDEEKMGLKNVQPLSPFKTKPQLKGWFIIDQNEIDLWEPLTSMALTFTQTLK